MADEPKEEKPKETKPITNKGDNDPRNSVEPRKTDANAKYGPKPKS